MLKYFAFATISIIMLSFACSDEVTNIPNIEPKINGKVTDTFGNLLHDVKVHLIFSLVEEPTISKEIVLPLHITGVGWEYFKTTSSGNDIILNWKTNYETNNDGFQVQRKQLIDFTTIGFVIGFGTTTDPKEYWYVDKPPHPGTYIYRLKQIDFDGTFTYSEEDTVTTGITPMYDTLYQNSPNPFSQQTILKYSLKQQSNCLLTIQKFNSQRVLAVLLNDMIVAGVFELTFDNTSILPNGLFNCDLQIGDSIGNLTVQSIQIFKNSTDLNLLLQEAPFVTTTNGEFEIILDELPLGRQVNVTESTSPEIIKTQEVSNELTFILNKTGYKVLELTYLIDMNKENSFNLILEKE